MIRLGHVEVTPKAKELVNKVLDSGEIGQSKVITDFENAFASWVGSKYCVAVSSGTMADTVALAVLKFMNPGKDEVIVPALTFIAQVNAIVYNGLKPVFVDVAPDLLMWADFAALKVNSKTLCVYPVHLLGKPCDMLSYEQMTAALKVPMVEDACEAMGSEFDSALTGFRKCGTFGEMGTFSFFPSHTITTGEGGMLATNSKECADLARRIINHGKISPKDFHFDVIGFNGKMSSVTAALGLAALEDVDAVINTRRGNYFSIGGRQEIHQKICPHAFPVILKSEKERDEMLEHIRSKGIECRNLFSSVPTQEKAYAYLGHRLGDFPMAESIGQKGLYVPVHQGLSPDDISLIKTTLGINEVAFKA